MKTVHIQYPNSKGIQRFDCITDGEVRRLIASIPRATTKMKGGEKKEHPAYLFEVRNEAGHIESKFNTPETQYDPGK